jgi:predicted permease
MKKLIIKLVIFVLSIVWFIFIHFKFRFIMKYPNGWNKITAYCIGVANTYPFFIAHAINGESPENAFMLAFAGSGFGTVSGWMLEDGRNGE